MKDIRKQSGFRMSKRYPMGAGFHDTTTARKTESKDHYYMYNSTRNSISTNLFIP